MEKQVIYRGSGLGTTLTIIFLILKLTNVITWSWWWVFSPMLFSIGLALLIFIVSAIIIIALRD